MATLTARGKAAVSGLACVLDVIVYPEPQSADLTHQYDVETVKDRQGQDCAKRARNEHQVAAWKFKLLGDTAANAKAGAAMLAPLAIVTVSGCDIADWNGVYIVEPGEKNSLKNTEIGDHDLTMLKYSDAAQNTLMTSIPA